MRFLFGCPGQPRQTPVADSVNAISRRLRAPEHRFCSHVRTFTWRSRTRTPFGPDFGSAQTQKCPSIVRTSSQPFGCAFPSHMSVHTGALRTGSRSAPIGDQPKSGLGSGPILSATALVLSVIALRVPAIYVLSTASTYIHVRACAHPCVCSCREETHNFDIYSDRPRRQGSEQRAARLRSLNRCVRDRILEFRLAVER